MDIDARMELVVDYISERLEACGYEGKEAGDFYWSFLEHSDLNKLIHDESISTVHLQAIWQRKFDEWLIKQPRKE